MHSHIDVGYTERQEKMTVYQADFIKQAVECALSPEQEGRGEKAKFKFTAEGFWAVAQYIERYGDAGKRRLAEAAATGYLEITAGYLHFAELLNYDNLNRSLDYAADFKRENGITDTHVAMAADINGFSYGYAEALYGHGVRYLSANINTHHGGPPFSKPLVPFYWKTHKGNRILVWNGLTYHKANLLGLIPGSTPICDPGVPGMRVEETGFVEVSEPEDYAEKRIFAMIEGLEAQGYAYDFLPIMGSALYTDNSPASDGHCALIEKWNKKHGDRIEIVTATLAEFFAHLEKYGGEIREYSGDWNDWWTDGVLSTPSELRLFRNAQRTLKQIDMLDPEYKIIDKPVRDEIAGKLIMYAEHTWGHSASHTAPGKFLVQQLDFRKTNYAVAADILAGRAMDGLCRKLGEGEFTARRPFVYEVINPHAYGVTAAVYVPTDFWEEARFTSGKYYIKMGGKKITAQRTFTLRGSLTVAVITLKARERVKLELIFGESAEGGNCLNDAGDTFSNKYYSFRFGADGVSGIINKATGKELLLQQGRKLGQPIYQVFPGGDRGAAAGFGYSARKKPESKIYEGALKKIYIAETGPVFTVIRAEYRTEGAKSSTVEYRLFNELARIEISADFAKELVTDPEGLYVTLPFQNGEWYIDKPGTLIKPGYQLPDTCCDYYPVDRGVILFDGQSAVTVNTPDSPMLTFGALKLWNFSKTIEPAGCAYSWILNNKWETNFRAACAGFLETRYVIEIVSGITSAAEAERTLEKNDIDVLCLRK
jgi:hypothetical protein